MIQPCLINGSFFTSNLTKWILENISGLLLVDYVLWGVTFVYTVQHLWYWRNQQLFDATFTWPSNGWNWIWTKTKHAWNNLSREVRLKYEVAVSQHKSCQNFFKLNVDMSAKG